MNILRAVYETLWNFVSTVTRRDYRGYSSKNLNLEIQVEYFQELQDIHCNDTSTTEKYIDDVTVYCGLLVLRIIDSSNASVIFAKCIY